MLRGIRTRRVFRGFFILFLATMLFVVPARSSTANVYIAQNSQGGATGADCADALPVSFFNSGANWGGSSTQIGPGTTIHLCGTFTMPAGTVCALSFQGSGSSSGQITLLFEAGASATAPYWTTQSSSASGDVGGFICSNGQNYLTVDGGSNGLIQATQNGANFNEGFSGAAINMDGCSNCEVKNITISDMYQAVQNSGYNNNDSYGIVWNGGSNVTIDNNTVHDCRWCIQYWYSAPTQSNISIYNNTIYNTDHCISIGDNDGGNILNGANLIYGNTCHDFYMFDAPSDGDHHDGFHIWAVHSNSVISDLKIYNNYIYGDIGQTPTSYIFMDVETGNSATHITSEMFNNVIANTSASDALSTGAGGFGEIGLKGALTIALYNNTFIGVGPGGCCNNTAIISETEGSTGTPALTIYNNIYSTLAQGLDTSSGGTIVATDYNDYYNLGNGAVRTPGATYSLSAWQSSSGSDTHSTSGNSNLGPGGTLQSGSAAIGAGTNLTPVGITALDSDRAGVLRPSSGSWDMGAYVYSTITSSKPNPPTKLTATIQ
jgi:hypothetical protein